MVSDGLEIGTTKYGKGSVGIDTRLQQGEALKGLIWMQFTGLKDKNGKEIYEGDIVKIKNGIPYEVRYDSKWLGWQPWRSFIEDDEMWFSSNIEIIGNLYENKELLKSP